MELNKKRKRNIWDIEQFKKVTGVGVKHFHKNKKSSCLVLACDVDEFQEGWEDFPQVLKDDLTNAWSQFKRHFDLILDEVIEQMEKDGETSDIFDRACVIYASYFNWANDQKNKRPKLGSIFPSIRKGKSKKKKRVLPKRKARKQD